MCGLPPACVAEGMGLESRKTPKANFRIDVLHSIGSVANSPQVSYPCFIPRDISFHFNRVIVIFQIGTMAMLHPGRDNAQILWNALLKSSSERFPDLKGALMKAACGYIYSATQESFKCITPL